MKIKTNYHTHNHRCGHATGSTDDYCQAGIKAGLEVLGISDHVPFPDNRWHEMDNKGKRLQIRMLFSELDSYSNEVESAKQKYQGQLKVLKSFECEYLPEFANFYKEELLGRLACDYLVGSVHYIKVNQQWVDPRRFLVEANELAIYRDLMIETIESGLFGFIAHPDLVFSNYLHWDSAAISCSREILECAQKNKMPLEINGQGMRAAKVERNNISSWRYPVAEFWNLAAEYDLKIIVNSDAHEPELVVDNVEVGRQFAQTFGISVTETLNF